VKKTIQRVAVIAALMAAAALIGAFVFLATPATLMPEASAALRSSESVEFSEAGGWLTFTPLNAEPQAGVIFYPGGRVPPAAYAPAMRQRAAGPDMLSEERACSGDNVILMSFNIDFDEAD